MKKSLLAYPLLTLLLIMGTSLSAQAQRFVTDIKVADDVVQFVTEGQFDAYTMTVAGPYDFYWRQRLSAEQAPQLNIDLGQGTLADGQYRLELTAQPNMPAALREALNEARVQGNQVAVNKLLEEAGIHPEALTYTTSFSIQKGVFIDFTAREQAATETTGEAQGGLAPVRLSDPAPALNHGPDALLGEAPTATTVAFDPTPVDPADLPSVLAASADPDRPWQRTHFQNTADDGTPILLEGYLRETLTQPGLYELYVREATADGVGYGAWQQGLLKSEAVDEAAFDYLTAESEAPRRRDIQHLDDVIITGSMCAGFDCVNGESFGFDTIRLKENNLRIKFDDTSSSASFPFNDWQLTANATSNGGGSYFAIDDITGGRTPFLVEAGAPSSSLYVDDGGRIGIKTSTPVVEIHNADGDTPTLRLEQNGSSGFTPQTWDVAGNESGFFIRDATNGSKLSFRIQPNTPAETIFMKTSEMVFNEGGSNYNVRIEGDIEPNLFFLDADVVPTGGVAGAIGIGTNAPAQRLHVKDGQVRISSNISAPLFELHDDATNDQFEFRFQRSNERLEFRHDPSAAPSEVLMWIEADGDVGVGDLPNTGTNAITNQFYVSNDADNTNDPIAEAWTTFSSRRWKSDIVDLEDALSLVQQLRGVRYTLKESGMADLGLIAEEVGEVIPEVVTYEENGVDAKSVNYARLVSVLIEAIKEQQEIIASQQTAMTGMESRLDRFETALERIEAMAQSSSTVSPSSSTTGGDR